MRNQRVIIDGLSLLFTEFHALIDLKNKSGWGTGMAFGTVKTLFYLFTKYRWHSSDIILAWDKKPAWKYELFPGYKAKRKQLDLPERMSIPNQIKLTQRCLEYTGINQAYCDGMESDDVCATLARLFSSKGRKVVILTKDHDMYQCLDENTAMLIQGREADEIYTQDKFIDKYGVLPDDYWKIQTLGGCTTDKVPGIKGISEQTASEIVKMNTWDKIINNDDTLVFSTNRSKNAFKKNYVNWDYKVCEKLVRLNKYLKPQIKIYQFNTEKLRKLFFWMEFKRYLQQDNWNRMIEVFK